MELEYPLDYLESKVSDYLWRKRSSVCYEALGIFGKSSSLVR